MLTTKFEYAGGGCILLSFSYKPTIGICIRVKPTLVCVLFLTLFYFLPHYTGIDLWTCHFSHFTGFSSSLYASHYICGLPLPTCVHCPRSQFSWLGYQNKKYIKHCKINFWMGRGELVSSAWARKLCSLPRLLEN